MLKALAREINDKGEMVALYCTLETLQNARDPAIAMSQARTLLLRCTQGVPGLAQTLGKDIARGCTSSPDCAVTAVSEMLTEFCRRVVKPLVVFFDEADCLAGDVLVSFLRPLRDGYVNRDDIPFPASIALVGMLDVRDYKAQIRPDGESLGQISPFNIISEDMLLRNFWPASASRRYMAATTARPSRLRTSRRRRRP